MKESRMLRPLTRLPDPELDPSSNYWKNERAFGRQVLLLVFAITLFAGGLFLIVRGFF